MKQMANKNPPHIYISLSAAIDCSVFLAEQPRAAVNMSRIVNVILILAVIYCAYSEAEVQSQNCKKNEQWNSCGSACEPSCVNPNPQICTFNCVTGCQCKSGFFRDNTGRCVTKQDCSSH